MFSKIASENFWQFGEFPLFVSVIRQLGLDLGFNGMLLLAHSPNFHGCLYCNSLPLSTFLSPIDRRSPVG